MLICMCTCASVYRYAVHGVQMCSTWCTDVQYMAWQKLAEVNVCCNSTPCVHTQVTCAQVMSVYTTHGYNKD